MRPKLLPAFGHRVTSQNPEGGASRSSRYDFLVMRTKLFKKPKVLCRIPLDINHFSRVSITMCSFCPDAKNNPGYACDTRYPFRNQRTAEQHRHPFLPERNPSIGLRAQAYQKMSCFCEIGGLGMINQPMM